MTTNPEHERAELEEWWLETDGTGTDACSTCRPLHICTWHQARLNELAAFIAKEVTQTEKAYGGCRNCFGKGFATVNDQWIGQDTDTDIGSPGGTIRGGDPIAMKYCTCERGKQLEGLVAKEVAAARAPKADFTKLCKPYNRELRVEASLRAIAKLDGELGKDYSMFSYGEMVCNELQELLNGTN